jgi:hypothetical protein
MKDRYSTFIQSLVDHGFSPAEAQVWVQSLRSKVTLENAVQLQERSRAHQGEGTGDRIMRILQSEAAAFLLKNAASTIPAINQVPPHMRDWALQLSKEIVKIQTPCQQATEVANEAIKLLNSTP